MTKQTLDDKYYETSDIDIASMLLCKGYTLEDVVPVTRIKVNFLFKNQPAIADVVDGFWSNRIEVRPLDFTNNRKNLKTRIFGMQKSS